MIDKNTILSFLEYYELTNATAKPISGGLSGCALMIDRKDKKVCIKNLQQGIRVLKQRRSLVFIFIVKRFLRQR